MRSTSYLAVVALVPGQQPHRPLPGQGLSGIPVATLLPLAPATSTCPPSCPTAQMESERLSVPTVGPGTQPGMGDSKRGGKGVASHKKAVSQPRIQPSQGKWTRRDVNDSSQGTAGALAHQETTPPDDVYCPQTMGQLAGLPNTHQLRSSDPAGGLRSIC